MTGKRRYFASPPPTNVAISRVAGPGKVAGFYGHGRNPVGFSDVAGAWDEERGERAQERGHEVDGILRGDL